MIENYDTLSIPDATKIQKQLRDTLHIRPFEKEIKTLAGADISFNRHEKTVYAGIVILSYPELRVVAHSIVKSEVHFPYVPGFLAFREIPPLIKAWQAIEQKPDVLLMDGHGIAHPRRMGIAAHFGTLVQHPTIGCAKKKLFGQFEEPDPRAGSYSPLFDKEHVIGYVLRTKNKVKPVFVSPGNLVGLEQSRELVLRSCRGYRLPEPTRQAHNLVNLFRKGEIKEGFRSY